MATMGRLAAAMVLTAGLSPAAGAQTVPEPVKARVNALVAQCAAAGGQLGTMTGQGQFVIPRDFNGDGRTDFLVSEGNFPCTGRPDLFRQGGLARVQLWIADAAGGARLAFDDRLLAYRVLDGRPAKLQVARTGPACGGPPRCGDELRWNAAAGRFDELPTDGRASSPRPAAGAGAPALGSAPGLAPGSAPGPAPLPAAPVAAGAGAALPPVQPGADARFRAACRKQALAENGQQAAAWVDGYCTDMWARAVAAQPLAEAVLIALGTGAGPVEGLKQRLAPVRWAPRPDQGEMASGRLGPYSIGLAGAAGRADRLVLGWRATGADIPVDLVAALEARGATATLGLCEKLGTGEGERAWTVSLPGRPPFALSIGERTAPTGGALSYWSAEVPLDGRPARKGQTRCERFW